MHRLTARFLGRSRALILVLLVLMALAAAAGGAPAAFAWHAGLDAIDVPCETCHTDSHYDWPVQNERCLNSGCHASYALPDRTQALTCWTCHAAGQDMSAAATDAGCVQTCHLADGSLFAHPAAHPGGSAACTSCHKVSSAVLGADGDPHHTTPPWPLPVVTTVAPLTGKAGDMVTLTGSGLTGTGTVAFAGVPARSFTVTADANIVTTVPYGAKTGVLTVTTPGGTATSIQVFVVDGYLAPAAVTLRLGRASLGLGGVVKASGVLDPVMLGGSRVTLTLQRRTAAGWKRVLTAKTASQAAGTFTWRLKPARRGAYRLRAAVAATAQTAAARSAWAAFSVK